MGGFSGTLLSMMSRRCEGGVEKYVLYGLLLAKEAFSDFGVSNLVAKSVNLVACFFKIVIICVFLAKYLIIGV